MQVVLCFGFLVTIHGMNYLLLFCLCLFRVVNVPKTRVGEWQVCVMVTASRSSDVTEHHRASQGTFSTYIVTSFVNCT